MRQYFFYIFFVLFISPNCFSQYNFLPIIAFQGIPETHTTDQDYKILRDAGFNVNLQMYSNITEVKKALDKCQKYNLKLIFLIPEFRDFNITKSNIDAVKNHPALMGYYLFDEPSPSKFDELKHFSDLITKYDSKHIRYINLHPIYAPTINLENMDYSKYVNLFLSKVNVNIISFDHYAIPNNKIRPRFYDNLEIIREKSISFRKPFWAFACSVIHFNYKKPTLSGLKLQQFSNLLYGAKGLQYYTYWGVNDAFWKANNYGYAIVDENGRPTPTYNLVKEVNGQINRLSWIFSKSKVDSVFHVGDTIPIGTKRMNFLPSKFKEFKTLSNKALVSFMSNGNNKYIVIMNKNLNKFLPFNYQVFQGVSMIDNNTGKSRRLSGQKQLSKIPPGDILIFTYKN